MSPNMHIYQYDHYIYVCYYYFIIIIIMIICRVFMWLLPLLLHGWCKCVNAFSCVPLRIQKRVHIMRMISTILYVYKLSVFIFIFHFQLPASLPASFKMPPHPPTYSHSPTFTHVVYVLRNHNHIYIYLPLWLSMCAHG